MTAGEIETTKDGVVVLNYQDLLDGKDLGASIEKAYGYLGHGLLVVKGIPQISELREKLLNLAPRYSSLPDAVKEKTVHKKSNYSFGWSHGKEILKPGVFDQFKGSYYNNPQYDQPFEDEKMIEQFPESCHPNIWPVEDFAEMRPAFMELGQTIVNVGMLVAQQCDSYTTKQCGEGDYVQGTLKKIIQESLTCKARLLYYFPINEDETERTRDSWCGWHNDHSSLTGLCPAMYFKMDQDKVAEADIPCPDTEAGLYAKSRDGKEVKIAIPRDCIAYQIGECSQIQTGGILRATPHAVQAIKYPESKNIGRGTFAVFMQPNVDVVLNTPKGKEDCAVGQYKPGMNFAEFSKVTIENYYAE